MTHLAGRCSCGRKQHYPTNAVLGTSWTCWKCGRTWTLSKQGEPLFVHRSKPPSPGPQQQVPSSGCNPMILVALAGFWIADMAMDAYLTAVRMLSRG